MSVAAAVESLDPNKEASATTRIVPRPEQIASRDALREAVVRIRKSKHRIGGPSRIMVSMPTGAGKTYLAAFLIHQCVKQGMRCIFIVDRLVLIDQTLDTLNSLGIEADVMQAGRKWNPEASVIIASANTLIRREVPVVDLVFVDEAHTMIDGVSEYLNKLPQASVAVGLSATPFKRELAEVWDELVNVTTTDKLIGNGTLTPIDAMVSVPLIEMKAADGSELKARRRGRVERQAVRAGGAWADR